MSHPRIRPTTAYLLAVTLAIQYCAACQGTATPTQEAIATAEETAEEPTAMSAPVITINPMMQRGQTVTLAAGDVFVVSLPPGYSIWTVNFAGEIIQPLTPAEKMSEPGPQGWLFQAVAAGQTDIRLTAPAPACAQPPCPPAAPVTFVFTIEVK